MQISKRAIKLSYIATDAIAAFLAWLVFYWYRSHLLGDMKPGRFFSLFYSGLAIALFWCLIYGFWGFYKDYFRKSRIKELYLLVSSVLLAISVA